MNYPTQEKLARELLELLDLPIKYANGTLKQVNKTVSEAIIEKVETLVQEITWLQGDVARAEAENVKLKAENAQLFKDMAAATDPAEAGTPLKDLDVTEMLRKKGFFKAEEKVAREKFARALAGRKAKTLFDSDEPLDVVPLGDTAGNTDIRWPSDMDGSDFERRMEAQYRV